MAMTQKDTTTIPEIGAHEYWVELSEALTYAKRLLWARIQRGDFHDDAEAKAAMEAYWDLKKVIKLQENKLLPVRQIRLPEEERTDGHH